MTSDDRMRVVTTRLAVSWLWWRAGGAVVLATSLTAMAGVSLGAPEATAQSRPEPRPTYRVKASDSVTADNKPRPVAHSAAPCPEKRPCYLPDPNPPVTEGVPVDSHTGDIYERPTLSGSGASRVLSALDIVSTQVGSDEEWFYFRINVAGRDPEAKGLPYSYGFELDFDDDVAGEVLVVVDDPSANLGTRFGTADLSVHWNQNDNIIGLMGLVPDDGPGGGDGYEVVAFEGGANRLTGQRGVPQPVAARVAPRGTAVEVAVLRRFLDVMKLNDAGIDLSGDVNEIGLRPAASAAPIDPGAFTLNDRFGRQQSGSPYPFLRLGPAEPGACPASDKDLSLENREVLDSGTDTDTGIPNPCYPTAAVAALDNSYYLHTTYTPEELAAQPSPISEEPAGRSTTDRGSSSLLLVLAGVVAVSGALALGWRRRDRRRSAAGAPDFESSLEDQDRPA